MVDDLWTASQCFTCFMGVLWFGWFFGETVKPLSLGRLPLDHKASPKLTDRSWPQSEKKWAKWGNQWWAGASHQMKVFKGKIKLNGGFSRPCLPRGQSVFFGSHKKWHLVYIHGISVVARRSTAMWLRERWHRSSFPMDFSISWWGHERRAGDFVWNSEKDDLKFRHLFVTVETSWNILEDLETSLFTTLFFFSCLSYFHSRRGRKPFKMCRTALGPQRVCGAHPAAGPVLVGSGRCTLECCHMLPWADQMKHEIDESLVVEVLFK